MNEIKPAGTLGLQIVKDGPDAVEVRIPLSENHNDKGTLFAGSIFSGAVFAGYRLAQNIMRQKRMQGALVCRDAAVRYLRPLGSDGTSRALPEGGFVNTPGGNRQILVRCDVLNDRSKLCATVSFSYVAVKER
jgi:thioesterase domain-containing protein